MTVTFLRYWLSPLFLRFERAEDVEYTYPTSILQSYTGRTVI